MCDELTFLVYITNTRIQEFPRASPWGTPSGEGVYLTVYPSSRPNTDTVHTAYAHTLHAYKL